MMRDICARFKYSEPSPSPSSAASTPRSVATDRERSGSEQSLDGMVAAADDATPACLPLPTPSNCPPRELIHRCLRRYHREMEAGATDLAAVGERIRDDLAPYSVLKLGGFSLGNVAPKILATVLVKSETLKTLDLGFNRINDRGAALLAKALEQNTSLQSLYLSGNDIGPVGAGSIAAALATNNTLKSLHLSGNNIGEEGIRQLTEGLKKNTGLRALYIGTNGIGSNGMKCIADALQVNQTLEELTLGQNKLCSQGLKHIAAAFATGTVKLTTLEIGKNSIDSEGVIALAKALCNAPNRLQNLYIDNNPIGDTGAGAFGALLAKNAILRVLDLSYTQMSLLGLRDLSVGLSYSTSLLCLLLDGHDWASTQYMKTANGLNGMSLSTKGANNFAASCIIGAINSNAKSLLYKLTGVDLVLVLGSLPINNIDRDYLAGEGVDGIGGRRPMDLVARNERILRYLQDQRAVAAATVNLKRKNEDVQNDTEMTEPQSQRQKTAENYQQLTVDTNAPPRNPAPRPAPTGVPPTVPLNSQRPPLMKASLMRGQNPRHPSWSTDRRLSLKSPRYETTMEVQVRKVIADIPRMPFDADEYAALQTYYLGGCHSPKVPAPDGIGHVAQQSPSSSASALSEKVVEQVPCPACQSSRLARYPRTMVLKAHMETKPDSDKQLIVLLRQLHYLVGVFQHVENAEHKIDAILASTHEAREQ